MLDNIKFTLLLVHSLISFVCADVSKSSSALIPNQCAFSCQNNGLCSSIGICYCESGWIGVDCSMPNSTDGDFALYEPRYSFVPGDFSNKNLATSSLLNVGLVQVGAGRVLWTKNSMSEIDFTVNATLRLHSRTGQGVALILMPIANINVSIFADDTNPFGIDWPNFVGIALKFEPRCSGVVVASRIAPTGMPENCIETLSNKASPLFDFTKFLQPFKVGVAVSAGALVEVSICTIDGCQVLLDQTSLSTVNNLRYFDLSILHFGIGAGLDAEMIDIFEIRTKTDDYIRSFSLINNDWRNVEIYGGFFPVVYPATIRLTSGTGAIWTSRPLDLTDMKINVTVSMAIPQGTTIVRPGPFFAVFIANNGSIQRQIPLNDHFGIVSGFMGLSVVVSPLNGTICVAFVKSNSNSPAENFTSRCPGIVANFPMLPNSFPNSTFRIGVRVKTANSSNNQPVTAISVKVEVCSAPPASPNALPCSDVLPYLELDGYLGDLVRATSNNSMSPFLGLAAISGGAYIDVSKIYLASILTCNLSCRNFGYCSNDISNRNNICICPHGWQGLDCSIPVCSTPCAANNIQCVAPDLCGCSQGWSNSPQCDIPVCQPHCSVHSTCVAPNNCSCIGGWTGPDCSTGLSLGRTAATAVAELPGGFSFVSDNTSKFHDMWHLVQPNFTTFDPPVGLVSKGALRLIPATGLTRAALWTKSTFYLSANVTLRATFEIGQTGTVGDGVAIFLANSDGASTSTNFGASNGRYMLKIGNFVGVVFLIQPSTGRICATAYLTASSSNTLNCTDSGLFLASTVPSFPMRTKLQVTLIVTIYGSLSVTACTISTCYPSKIFPLGGPLQSLATVPLVLGLGAENSLRNYDFVDVYELLAYNIVSCSPPCIGTNQACTADGSCSCQDGWTGPLCMTPTCTPSCLNGGSCIGPNQCACSVGYTGINCETSQCSFLCANGGTCVGTNLCWCANGWTGPTCELTSLLPSTGSSSITTCTSPCLNGGSCIGPNQCACSVGYTGTNCETSQCSFLCANGGTCVGTNLCWCANGWAGPTCELSLVSGNAITTTSSFTSTVTISSGSSAKSIAVDTTATFLQQATPGMVKDFNFSTSSKESTAYNLPVVIFIAVMSGILIILGVVMLIMDQRDLLQWAFLPCDGNATSDQFRYLISVFCVGHRNCDLDAKVSVRLLGDVGKTEARQLIKNNFRKNFTGGQPSNFLLTSSDSAGLVEAVELSVASNGQVASTKAKELNVDKIVVSDILKSRKFIFRVNAKIGANEPKSVELAREEDVLMPASSLLAAHLRAAFIEHHLWLSTIKRPLPSNCSRCERVACIASAYFLAMVINALLYGRDASLNKGGFNFGKFELSMFTFWTSLASCFFVLLPTSLTKTAFQLVERRPAVAANSPTIFNLNLGEIVNDGEKYKFGYHEKRQKKQFLLPFFVENLAWLWVVITVIASGGFVGWCSCAWDFAKGLQWIAGMILCVLLDFFLIQVLKVLAVAVFNSFRKQIPDDGIPLATTIFRNSDEVTDEQKEIPSQTVVKSASFKEQEVCTQAVPLKTQREATEVEMPESLRNSVTEMELSESSGAVVQGWKSYVSNGKTTAVNSAAAMKVANQPSGVPYHGHSHLQTWKIVTPGHRLFADSDKLLTS